MKPEFATNRDGERVADAIAGYFDQLIGAWRDPFDLAIATAYFNPGGFALLAKQVERAGSVRLLLGAEPKSDLAQVRHLSREVAPSRAEGRRLEEALRTLEGDVVADRNLLGFTEETDALLERLIAWLERENVASPSLHAAVPPRQDVPRHDQRRRGDRRLLELHVCRPRPERRAEPRPVPARRREAGPRVVRRALGGLGDL